jgi:hypothetical protein
MCLANKILVTICTFVNINSTSITNSYSHNTNISNGISFNIIKKKIIPMEKIIIRNEEINTNNIVSSLSILDIPYSICKTKFSLNSLPLFTGIKRNKLVYIKKKLGIFIVKQYNYIIYYKKLKSIGEREAKLLDAQIAALENLHFIDDYIIDFTLNTKRKKLLVKQQIHQAQKQINILKNELKYLCNLSSIHENFIVPFLFFEEEKILSFILKSFYLKKNYYKFTHEDSKNINMLKGHINTQDINSKHVFFGVSSSYSNNKAIESFVKTYYKSKYLHSRFFKRIMKKYYRIHVYYKIIINFKNHREVQQQQIKNAQNKILLLGNSESIKNKFKIYKLQLKIIEMEKAALERRYESVLNSWKMALELIPINFYQVVFEIAD